MVGYSGTPLDRKLGIKPGWRVAYLGAEVDQVEKLGLPRGDHALSAPTYYLVLAFCRSVEEMHIFSEMALAKLDRAGSFWVAWPKKSSGIVSDMTEQSIRDHLIPLGLVDNKVCAVDEIWSGLRMVYRLEHR